MGFRNRARPLAGLWYLFVLGGLATCYALGGCRASGPADASKPVPGRLVLATTTSLRDTGLVDALVPAFEAHSGIRVEVVAVGSGQALELGRRGDADVLLVHSPEAEKQFIAQGHARLRRPVMYNDFVLVGPAADPAGVKTAASIHEALRRLARAKAPFVSRGDNSGTHARELSLWAAAGIHPEPPWYIEAGSGMAEVLRMASQKGAYTLADRGTYLSLRGRLDLEVLWEGDPALRNVYSVIVPSGPKNPAQRQRLAQQFADFLFSAAARRLIGDFGKDRTGQPLFFLEEPNP